MPGGPRLLASCAARLVGRASHLGGVRSRPCVCAGRLIVRRDVLIGWFGRLAERCSALRGSRYALSVARSPLHGALNALDQARSRWCRRPTDLRVGSDDLDGAHGGLDYRKNHLSVGANHLAAVPDEMGDASGVLAAGVEGFAGRRNRLAPCEGSLDIAQCDFAVGGRDLVARVDRLTTRATRLSTCTSRLTTRASRATMRTSRATTRASRVCDRRDGLGGARHELGDARTRFGDVRDDLGALRGRFRSRRKGIHRVARLLVGVPSDLKRAPPL